MKVAIVTGSHRPSSQSEKVGRYVQHTLQAQGIVTRLLSLGGNPLPLWDEGLWNGDEKWQHIWQPWSDELLSSDALVIITPEWHGQVPAGLKNFFLLCGSGQELAHKPALIIAVSSSNGGAYPVAELRMSSYKNCRICYLPEHIIIRYVESVLNEDPTQNNTDSDAYIRERMAWALELLKSYADALKPIRASGVTHNSKFQNGM